MTNSEPTTIPVMDADYFSEEAVADPTAFDGRLREMAPVVHMPEFDLFFIGRQELIQKIITDWRNYSSMNRPIQGGSATPQILVTQDPPEHAKVRAALIQFMTPAALKRAFDQFVAVAEEQVDEWLKEEVVDGFQIAAKFVLKVFPDYLGLPTEGRHHLLKFGEAIFNAMGPDNERAITSMAEAAASFEWIATQCSREAVIPGGLADLVYSLPKDGVVSEEEAGLLVRTLFAAGFDTSVLAITAVFHYVSRDPDQWRAMADPNRLKRAFEEAIRMKAPPRFIRRTTKEDCEIGGLPVKKGSLLLLSLAAAGRDPRKWDDPDKFDVMRPPRPHLSLGAGIHTCIGQSLARLEYEALFSVLIRKVARIESVGESVPFRNNNANGWKSVPIRLIAA